MEKGTEVAKMPEWFEEWDEEVHALEDKLIILAHVLKYQIFGANIEALADEYTPYTDYVHKNHEKVLKAIIGPYEIEPEENVYCFTLKASQEIDILATSFEEAQRRALKEWGELFSDLRVSSGVYHKWVVDFEYEEDEWEEEE